MKKLTCLVLSTICLATQALASDGVLLDCIAAVVNDGIVLHSELDQQLISVRRGLSEQDVALPPEQVLKSQVLESLILKRLQMQRAERLGIAVSDQDLNRSLEQVAQRNGLTLSQLPLALGKDGIDYGLYREEARIEMILEQLRVRDVVSRIDVSLAEVEQLLEQSGANDQEYELYHILVAVSETAEQAEQDAAQAKAQDIYQRLQDGEDFGPLAVAYSDTPGVLKSRGSLGYRQASEIPSIFADQVTQMDVGELAEPIRSPSGFHIIKLNDLRGAEKVMVSQIKARHILISPDEIVTDEMAQAKIQILKQRLDNGEDFAELAENESDDTTTARRGGDLGWSNPGTFVPEFEAQLAELEPAQVSQPFKTQFGWHIVELLDTREHDSTDTVRQNQAAAMIRARKFEEEAQIWMRQLRDEAYVETRADCISS